MSPRTGLMLGSVAAAAVVFILAREVGVLIFAGAWFCGWLVGTVRKGKR